ncbi:shikimate dehydrogenase family protein [Frigoriflavimonas asaccharolytica]|uniref:Shikimate dehydrogenase n=1 Tax=Frigoriflavimonas asaccharolytica TaxID=2735899 RepID=A0A8J8G721_9FLAO|nr:shikimate dehydrogenase [Frigoriflavimonas asaccharolytica]NRS92454.1 shikimate dehydrogenase [Frigoriflavimonas asaccharolytica]
MKTKKLGLIGKNISYSFSKIYFETKFKNLNADFNYDLFDIPSINDVEELFKIENIVGLNVTQPYKEAIIPFLDELSEEALQIGAVNTILIQNEKKIGYNTDAFGFEKTLLLKKNAKHEQALILGNGGAAKAIQFVLNKHNIPFQIISRKGDITFEDLDENLISNHQIIINSTPVGTFPDIKEHIPFPFQFLTENHLVIDLIYNPEITEFLRKSANFGAKTLNGQYMLEQQAEKAWQIWNS